MSVRFWSDDFCAACAAASASSAVACACFTSSTLAQPLARIASAAMEIIRPLPNIACIFCLLDFEKSPRAPSVERSRLRTVPSARVLIRGSLIRLLSRIVLGLCLAMGFASAGETAVPDGTAPSARDTRAALRALVEGPQANAPLHAALDAFYAQRAFKPVWSGSGTASARAASVLTALADA